MTIKEAIRIKTGEAKINQIISDFQKWIENEIALNILRDKTNLAEFVFTQENVLKYGAIEIKLPKIILLNLNFLGHLSPYINSLCEEYGLERYSINECSEKYKKENVQYGGVIKFKCI